MKKNIVAAFLMIFVMLQSCQKDFTIDNVATVITTPSLADTILLRKFILIDTTLAAPNDTLYTYSFAYDNLTRCTLLTARGIVFGNNVAYIQNYYNGTDSLISKRKIWQTNSPDSTIDFFIYSQVGKMLSDSILEYSNIGLTNFNFDYQAITNQGGIIINKSNGQLFEKNNYLINRDNNDNIIYEKDSTFLYNGFSYAFLQTTTNTISYDNKICPFYKLFPKFLVQVQSEGSTSSILPPFHNMPQKNNILVETNVVTPTVQGVDNCNNTYQYSYNVNNYPVIVIVKDILNNKTYKGVYIY